MLLSLNINSIRSLIAKTSAKGRVGKGMALSDVPKFIKEEFGLNGLALTADLLAGKSRPDLEAFRERSDRSGCACLLLRETKPLALGSLDEAVAAEASDRLDRIVHAGHFLGTNAVAFTPKSGSSEDELDFTAEAIKRAMSIAEKYEMNLLIYPGPGMTKTAEQVTSLLKRIGGFRVGTLPDFQYASTFDDPAGYLRTMCPYASAVSVSMLDFVVPESEKGEAEPEAKPAGLTKEPAESSAPKPTKEAVTKENPEPQLAEPPSGAEPTEDELDEFLDDLEEYWQAPVHTAYDIVPMMQAVLAVGYDGALMIDYRGSGDPVEGVQNCIYAIEDAVRVEAEK